MTERLPSKETILENMLFDLDEKSVEEAIVFLQDLSAQHSDRWERLSLSWDWSDSCDGRVLSLKGYLIKTEEEKRKEREVEQAKAQKALDELLKEAKEKGFSLKGIA